jgi:hypothetical protein
MRSGVVGGLSGCAPVVRATGNPGSRYIQEEKQKIYALISTVYTQAPVLKTEEYPKMTDNETMAYIKHEKEKQN